MDKFSELIKPKMMSQHLGLYSPKGSRKREYPAAEGCMKRKQTG